MHRARVIVAAAVVAVVSIAAGACEPPPPPPPPPVSCGGGATTTARDLPYASVPGVAPRLLSLDLTVPARPAGCGPAPVVVWVHGGGFAIGDKANGVDDMVRWATAQGWALARVNYRLSPNPPTGDPGRVRHPTHVQDIAAAMGWLEGQAATRRLDPNRFALVGHSAGAFLVSLLATDGRYLTAAGVAPAQVRAVAALDTRYDITSEIADGDATAEAMYRNAFGDDPATWRSASPLTHAGPGDPPFVVVTRGRADRRAAARTFGAALDEATVVDASPLSHAEVGDLLGRAGDTVVTPPVTTLFRRALNPGG